MPSQMYKSSSMSKGIYLSAFKAWQQAGTVRRLYSKVSYTTSPPVPPHWSYSQNPSSCYRILGIFSPLLILFLFGPVPFPGATGPLPATQHTYSSSILSKQATRPDMFLNRSLCPGSESMQSAVYYTQYADSIRCATCHLHTLIDIVENISRPRGPAEYQQVLPVRGTGQAAAPGQLVRQTETSISCTIQQLWLGEPVPNLDVHCTSARTDLFLSKVRPGKNKL